MLSNLIHHSTHNILPAQSTVVDFEFTWVPLIWTQYFACTQNSGWFWITWLPFILSLMNYTAAEMFEGKWFLAGNQGNHQNFDPFLISKNLWLIFMEIKQKWKLVTNYVIEWMGLNFYDYGGLQPKMIHPKR